MGGEREGKERGREGKGKGRKGEGKEGTARDRRRKMKGALIETKAP